MIETPASSDRAAELRQRPVVGELLDDGRLARAVEDGVAVAVERERHARREEDGAHQPQVCRTGLGLAELRPDFSGRVVFRPDQREMRAAPLQPVVA